MWCRKLEPSGRINVARCFDYTGEKSETFVLFDFILVKVNILT